MCMSPWLEPLQRPHSSWIEWERKTTKNSVSHWMEKGIKQFKSTGNLTCHGPCVTDDLRMGMRFEVIISVILRLAFILKNPINFIEPFKQWILSWQHMRMYMYGTIQRHEKYPYFGLYLTCRGKKALTVWPGGESLIVDVKPAWPKAWTVMV